MKIIDNKIYLLYNIIVNTLIDWSVVFVITNKKTDNKVLKEKNERYNVLNWEQYKEHKKKQINKWETKNQNKGITSSYTPQYILSFIIPLVGFILGAILLSKDSVSERKSGTNCILFGLLSLIIGIIFWQLF